MFDKVFIKKMKNFGIFIVIYTLFFALFFSTISYTLPFVLGVIIAIITIPLTRFIRCKLKFPNGIASLASTLIVFITLFLILSTIILKVSIEIKQLLISMPSIYLLSDRLQGYINDLRLYYDQIDPSIIERVQSQLTTFISTGYDIFVNILKRGLTLAIGLPIMVMIIFITLIATFFFTRDLPQFKSRFLNVFSTEGSEKVRAVWSEAVKMIASYLRAYSIVITVGFLETLIGLSLLKIKYALLLSLLASFLDVLPILGMAALYFPLAIFFILSKNYLTAIFLIIIYVIITIVRQILEPKLVSSSLGLHPIAVLASIFIGIKAYGFLGMIYLLSLLVFYNILKKTDIL